MIKDTISKLQYFLRGKKFDYCQVFNKKNMTAKRVLLDLAKFCRAHKSTYHQDARVHAVLEGRREVWLHIQNYLNLTDEELYELYEVKSNNN